MMWTFIFLYVLRLNICQATGNDSSTQMYFAKLTIEESAIDNITELLKPFVSGSLTIDRPVMTTICQDVSKKTECKCKPSYRWSDKICKSTLKCCGNKKCTFPENSAHMCVSNTSVIITGSITLTGTDYFECLSEKSTDEFKQCNQELTKKMKKVYSTLEGFDTLEITKYSPGSIIADFEVTFAYAVDVTKLKRNVKNLAESLSASLDLKTQGVVHLEMPSNPVSYKSKEDVTCTSQQDLGTQPTWQLEREGIVYNITNGTESTVTSVAMESQVTLKNISELWAGNYICVYIQKTTSYTISHIASAVMDVSLLPDIDITADPAFPLCTGKGGTVPVKAKCKIDKSEERYTVKWNKTDTADIKSVKREDVYIAETAIRCDRPNLKPQLTCTFKNRNNQTRAATTEVNIINETSGEKFCKAEDDWGNTKARFTAVLKCKKGAGQRRRTCNSSAVWEEEFSGCVNQDLKNVLEKANIVDIGLGSLDQNSANVFNLLQNVTNNTESINTFANMNASVHVLFSLSGKLRQIENESAVKDLLESSSNLLEKSLGNSWKTRGNETSLAETYLKSVEDLIEKTNLIQTRQKERNIEVVACINKSRCSNTVYNVSIELKDSEPGNVKTTGFKELDGYLPHNNDSFKPNSIVVSATTTTKRRSNSDFQITITFQLIKARRRNIMMSCVSWDFNTSSWSEKGCKWKGPLSDGVCTCSHLSSFAILMSKYPMEVKGLTEITYTGLAVSVISLIISLVIELLVWNAVVKTSSLYLRHTAHVNISICLLVADCCFLASSNPLKISEIWCKTFVVLKHFCYLSMFFWMLCLSTTLLHQAIFLFHSVSKKNYLRFSLILGYACPLLIVTITFLANKGGAEGVYFSRDTCWLIYSGPLKGSIHTFILPVGIIVFLNVFSMLVVIMKLLDHPKNTDNSQDKEKKAALTVMRSVILLTPVFGVTWIFGFTVTFFDLTYGDIAYVCNYAFTLLNAFQGLFLLLTTCLGDQLTREALLKRLKITAPSTTTDSTTKLDSTWKK